MDDKTEFTFAEAGKYTVVNSGAPLLLSNWKNYEIDFSKVTTLDDVINILRGLRIIISLNAADPDHKFEPLMPYLREPQSSSGDERSPR